MVQLERINLYVEKVDIIERFCLFDFISDREFLYFRNRGDVTEEMTVSVRTPTMLLVQKFELPQISFSEGDIVSIDAKVMLKLQFTYNQGTNVIAFEINSDNNVRSLLNNISVIRYGRRMYEHLSGTHPCNPCSLNNLNGQANIEVIDVGQGSWNRISSGSFDTIFDCGCSMFYSRAKCTEIIQQRGGIPRLGKRTTLIISHWDIDHYNLLCALEDYDLENFCCVFVPDMLISLTSKHVFKRLFDNCQYLNVIEEKRGKSTGLAKVYEGDYFIVWSGFRCKNINKSGLALGIHGDKDMFIFSADHTYKQLWDVMYNDLISIDSDMRMNFVVPHHGGNAGAIGTKKPICAGKAIVSTGKNNYRHPQEGVRRYLCDRMDFEWIRTDWERDDIKYSVTLA